MNLCHTMEKFESKTFNTNAFEKLYQLADPMLEMEYTYIFPNLAERNMQLDAIEYFLQLSS